MKLNLVIALACEAKPIIQAFNLKKDVSEHVFEIYHDQKKNLCLIISGTGKINAAAATTYIALYHKTTVQGFLNIGCAGGQFAIGEMYAVAKISQQGKLKAYYPKINFLKNMPVKPLETQDVPALEYPIETMVDMEGYGFYQTAVKFTNQEFIHLIKIISDNSVVSMQVINSEVIKQLIENQREQISEVIKQQLSYLMQEGNLLKEPTQFSFLIEKFHFSQQQRQQLERLLQRAEIFFESHQIEALIKNATSSQSILNSLNRQLESHF